MKLRKTLAFLLSTALLLTLLAACGGNQSENASGGENASGELIQVKVGIGNGYVPFCYLDENEEEAGYEYEVMLAVADLLSDKYSFTIIPDAFENMLIGLDTGAYDVAIHHFGYTESRAENYLYAEEADFYTGNFHLAYLAGRTDITNFEDLDGKTLAVKSGGSKSELVALAYLEEHPELNVEIAYYDGTEELHAGIVSGLYDANLSSSFDINTFSSQFDNYLEYTDWYIEDTSDTGTYFIYNYGSEELQQDIDEAIRTLRENGTLSKLCIEIIGADYTVQ